MNISLLVLSLFCALGFLLIGTHEHALCNRRKRELTSWGYICYGMALILTGLSTNALMIIIEGIPK